MGRPLSVREDSANTGLGCRKCGSIYTLFHSDAGGTFCGGVAWTMVRVYRVFGFTSWVYHHGTKTGWPVGHSTTLVRIGNQILIEDAYFNHTYVDRRGSPLDVRDVVRLTRAKRLGAIRRSEPKTAEDRDIIYGPDDYQQALRGEGWLARSWPQGDRRNPHDCTTTLLGYTKCKLARVDWLRFQRFYWPWMVRYYPEATKTLTRSTFDAAIRNIIAMPAALASDVDNYVSVGDRGTTPTHRLLRQLVSLSFHR